MTAGTVKGKRGSRGPLLPYEEARRAQAWLKDARKASGLSNAQIGLRMYVSAAWVGARVSGSPRMTAAEVEEIARVLGVPVPDLTGGAG